MKRRAHRLIWTGMLLASMVLSASLYAQMAGGQQMSGMMRTMADEMMQMSRQMSKGDMDAATQQRMQEHMRDMGNMMENMSEMMGKGMMDPDMQQQMEQMHERVHEMLQQSQGGGGKQ